MVDHLSQRILVTGGAGFIGIPLVKKLLGDGHGVAVLDKFVFPDRRALLPKHPALCVFENDLLVAEPVQEVIRAYQPTVVFHLAAMHYIPLCNEFPSEALAVNIVGTQNLLSAIRQLELNRFVYASSVAVYLPTDRPLREEGYLQPLDVYGISKVAGEMIVRLHHELTGQSCVLARLFNVYGSNDANPHIIPDILQQLKASTRKIKLGRLDTQRDFIFVSDVVRALVVLMKKDGIGLEAFNIGSGTAISMKEAVETIGSILGVDIEIEVTETRKRKMDPSVLLANIDKLRGYTGWRPEFDFISGIKAILRPAETSDA